MLGNPPYKEKAKGRGGWIEGETRKAEKTAPLAQWMPPREWGVGAHSKHLRNLYIYFWRWATWKVFDHHPESRAGIVSYITVAGFLGGPGFQKMRDYLRRTCDDIWVIDCSPEGHQPEVSTRIFEGVQQPVCIVLASRSAKNDPTSPAKVRFHALPAGHRTDKFTALGNLRLQAHAWTDCPTDWRAPFLPAPTGAWATYPKLEDLFTYNGSGVMPGRTWIIAPDYKSLERRWQKLINAPAIKKEILFHPHLRRKGLGDRHSKRVVHDGLPGYEIRPIPVSDEHGECEPPVLYGFRSFDRQWIIPDNRLVNQPNPALWRVRSNHQIFITAPSNHSPTNGPALTMTAVIPDLDHYNGRGGRVFPLWSDADASSPNLPPKLLPFLAQRLGRAVSAEDVVAYVAAVAAHPAFTARFHDDLATPGLRLPITADTDAFFEATALGRAVIWLHTFGERMADPEQGRPAQPPRLAGKRRPSIPKDGAISQISDAMPNSIDYDEHTQRLLIGTGYVENVPPAVWSYEVSGKRVLLHWFSYRKRDRTRPIIGDRRPPSPLGNIQPDHWLAAYTTELINVLNVLGWLVEIEPQQAALLEQICAGPTIGIGELQAVGALASPATTRRSKVAKVSPALFG